MCEIVSYGFAFATSGIGILAMCFGAVIVIDALSDAKWRKK